jgi:hypothetical protein
MFFDILLQNKYLKAEENLIVKLSVQILFFQKLKFSLFLVFI